MVIPAALSAERLPAPSTRSPRMSMALSFALHGLAITPLFLIGAPGGATDEQPALMLELALAAPTHGPETEASSPESAESLQTPPEPPVTQTEQAEATPPQETQPQPEVTPEPELVLELPPPDEPPPVNVSELPPLEPPKPPKPSPPQPKPPAARPAAKPPTVARSPSPDTGADTVTQQTAASAPQIVFEGKPRYRIPPTPAVYPPRAVELGQQGEALVRVRLDANGTAAEILLWRGSGFDLLDRAALKAVRGWHFLPAVRDGRPVPAWVEIPVRFHLR